MTRPIPRADITELTGQLDDLSDPATPDALLGLLRTLYATGRRDLPLGRLFEGHVDALQIIARYGTPAQAIAAHQAARQGAAFGVWNADKQGDPLHWREGRLDGGKAFASGAGILTHALVSVDVEGARQLLLVDLSQVPPQIDRTWWRVTGMQRSETHIVRWTSQGASADMRIGTPGSYVREPWFSGGALRFAAVQAGGIAALFDHVRDHLVAQDRAADPHQASRLAALYAWAQAAADAVARAAHQWNDEDAARTLAYVAAARVAVYEAGEQALTIAQAAVGLQAMFVDHPIAATITDLAVYLRQPGPDAQTMRTGQAVAARVLTPTL
jgi:hypothetical protein